MRAVRRDEAEEHVRQAGARGGAQHVCVRCGREAGEKLAGAEGAGACGGGVGVRADAVSA